MKKPILIGCMLLCALAFGQKNSHELWTAELKKYVSEDGKVNYKKWKESPEGLANYISILEKNPPQDYWKRNDSLAYFINAYNAVTVKLILDNYPIKSIRRLITPWRFKRFELNGKKVSLNHIEHQILRKMKEPRIHFAINCASASCPNLPNEAFYAHRMNAQLEKASYAFMNDPSKNKINETSVEVSKIFFWFQKDFGDKKQRRQFISRYAETPISEDAKWKFLPYDWALNE